MSKVLAVLRNPYALIAQGFLVGGLIVFATQDGRQAVAAPSPSTAASQR